MINKRTYILALIIVIIMNITKLLCEEYQTTEFPTVPAEVEITTVDAGVEVQSQQKLTLQLETEAETELERTTEVKTTEAVENETTTKYVDTYKDESVLTPRGGINYNANGYLETYYNLDMTNVIANMRDRGFSKKEYPYWIREDGVKMLGDYVIVAADLDIHPRGSTVHTSLGEGLVCDTGSFANSNSYQFDIAVDW